MKNNEKETPQAKTALSVFIKLLRATETVTSAAHRHLAADGLTISQFGILEALLHLGPLCQRDLGQKILKSGGNITTVIDNLEKRDLVKRQRQLNDRRYIAVHLTDAGEKLIRQVFPRHVTAVVEALGILDLSEQEELSRLCRKLGRKGKKT